MLTYSSPWQYACVMFTSILSKVGYPPNKRKGETHQITCSIYYSKQQQRAGRQVTAKDFLANNFTYNIPETSIFHKQCKLSALCGVSWHSGRPHYGPEDTWRWFTPPSGPDLSLPQQRLHWVSFSSSEKAFITIIPIRHFHGNTPCYVISYFFLNFLPCGAGPCLPSSTLLALQAVGPD